jgi:hypothetical protein
LLDESGPDVPCLDLAGVADSPLDDSVGEDPREPRAGGRQRVEEEFAIAESVGQAGEQFPDFTLGEIHEKPFGDDHGRPVSGYLVQPGGIGHRRADHAVCVGLVVQLAPELDDAGLIEVEPLHGLGRVDPECPGIQTAAEV